MIAHYQGSDEWETELLQELEKDRIGLIEDQTGDSTVAMVVDARSVRWGETKHAQAVISVVSSLRMVDEFSSRTLIALGCCPEDTWIRHEVCMLICAADSDVVAAGKVSTMTIRKTIKLLLDRCLLQGR